MERGQLILGKNQYYSMDCYKTQLNNNVLVVGASGAGKTRSLVSPNILQATGSYIVTDPKGNLYDKYGKYLKKKGYVVKKLDFTRPEQSAHYNFFKYIRKTQDVIKIAHMLTFQDKKQHHSDPFWDESTEVLLQAVIAYLKDWHNEEERNFHSVMKLIAACEIGYDSTEKNALDRLFDEREKRDKNDYAAQQYRKFRVAADKTLRSILISVNARLGRFDLPELNEMMKDDDIDIESIGQKKTALFVVVSDTDRSLDGLVNIFFTQAMNVLCEYADRECKNCELPVPVRFIMDDFATNCTIKGFPRMISSIRSRRISVMLMIQAEAQLRACYGEDDLTIIGNCDSYVYLGSNDYDTAESIAKRVNVPVEKILYMPVGTNWIFRRGQKPVNGVNFVLEEYDKIFGEEKEL